MSAIEGLRGPARAPLGAGLFASPSLALFMSLFTSQAAVLVLSPILVEVAREFGVSTSTAGQLRVVAAPVAAVVAIVVARSAGRLPVRSLLAAGAALVGTGSIASAAAPSFVVLALAQVPAWIGVAVLVAGGIGAAGSWSAPEARSHVVARALAGAPAAWVVGMPVIGLVTDVSWRLAFIAVPLPASLATGAVLLATRPDRAEPRADASLARLLRHPGAITLALGELLAMSAWAGTLVFSGALFVEEYGASPRVTGLLLATVAVAYLVGNVLGGRIHHDCLGRALARGNVAAAATVALTWVITPNVAVTLLLFSFAAAVVAARTVVGTAYGFGLAGERTIELGAARAVITHVGYLAGSFIGGAALAVAGHAAVGIAFGALFLAATSPFVTAWSTRCAGGGAITLPHAPPRASARMRRSGTGQASQDRPSMAQINLMATCRW
jgi:predicted MFS family arabinose efflux permease